MEKSADAFRTISEVAEDLVLPQHVLRFWEQRFPQIRPLKRAGGRRYYRPADVTLLRAIRQLLYDDGYTIKGVQRLLKEQGVRGLRGDGGGVTLNAEASEDGGPDALEVVPPHAATGPSPPDANGLREVLACVEECERILLALSHPRG